MADRLPPRVRLALSVCLGCLVGVLAVLVATGGGAPVGRAPLVDGFAGAQLPPGSRRPTSPCATRTAGGCA